MPATGELIRLMNYIDDIATTLRRISASIPAMTKEESARLANISASLNRAMRAWFSALRSG